MEIKTVGVVGAGSMGAGIANAFALNGYDVILNDMEERFLDAGINHMNNFMARSVEKGKLTEEDKQATLNRITTTTDLQQFKEVDLVVEAIIENMDAKQQLFRQLDDIVRDDVILGTNTSSLSITEIASSTNRADRVAGMHFFNPAQMMRLVEVVRGLETSDETVSILKSVSEVLQKEVVEVKKDSPGFIVNRIMIPQFIEAIKVLEEGIASKEDIDKAMRYGLNHPMGSFELQDYAGVDIGYHVMEYFQKEFADNRFAPPLLLKNMIRAGKYGKKSGEGFYQYKHPKS
ncbi:3-hydroxyacyl-CoA dehydrogenase family protein [Oceanobacillus saliphilus]|uniref:3-hydroxyacyl-CoA dehydrogenase family protein n=1 Tax=Oceanobacillus saliphilus TaxID=2925834 RepID=UPI00201D725E|nr:3-hydroxyacyl-CoA dehydrogenase NAD-binding domain-containing protein [Oceanobacillus saliphilus]